MRRVKTSRCFSRRNGSQSPSADHVAACHLNVNNDFLHFAEASSRMLTKAHQPSSPSASSPETTFEALMHQLDRLDKCVKSSVSSLLMGLYYAKKLSCENPEYARSKSSTQMFLMSLLLSFKYLNDEGENDFSENVDEMWTAAADDEEEASVPVEQQETEFLDALQWRLHIAPDDFNQFTAKFLRQVLAAKIRRRDSVDYGDCDFILSDPHFRRWISYHLTYTIKVLCAAFSMYLLCTASLVTAAHLVTSRGHQSHMCPYHRVQPLVTNPGEPSLAALDSGVCHFLAFFSLTIDQLSEDSLETADPGDETQDLFASKKCAVAGDGRNSAMTSWENGNCGGEAIGISGSVQLFSLVSGPLPHVTAETVALAI